jgi:hypothetical protein
MVLTFIALLIWQFLILLAALVLTAEAALPYRRGSTTLDVVNANIKSAQQFSWTSVDQGDKASHYKNFELFVRRPSFPELHLYLEMPRLKNDACKPVMTKNHTTRIASSF